MKMLIVLLTLLMGFSAQAKTVTFSCQTHDWDIVFSTDVDDNAVEVRRAYEYSPSIIIYLRIPLTSSSTNAEILVSEDGKTYEGKAYCEMAGL